jgi:hypothetical protein
VTAARLDDRGKREGGPFSLELAPDGAFDFGSLPPGRYTLEVTLSGAGSPRDRLAGRDVDLREGEPPADLVILASLPLRVADAPGEGVRARRPTPRNIEIGPLFANAESKPEAPSLPGGDQPIAIQAPVTLRVLLDLLAAGGLLAVDIEPGVEASGVLERAHAAGPSVRPLREQLQEALGANGLRLEAEAGRLRIVR